MTRSSCALLGRFFLVAALFLSPLVLGCSVEADPDVAEWEEDIVDDTAQAELVVRFKKELASNNYHYLDGERFRVVALKAYATSEIEPQAPDFELAEGCYRNVTWVDRSIDGGSSPVYDTFQESTELTSRIRSELEIGLPKLHAELNDLRARVAAEAAPHCEIRDRLYLQLTIESPKKKFSRMDVGLKIYRDSDGKFYSYSRSHKKQFVEEGPVDVIP